MAIQYHQQKSFCGKQRCKRCGEGVGHGPYWYAYETVDGRTSRRYVGKVLPEEVQRERLGTQSEVLVPTSIRIYTLGQLRIEVWRDQKWELVTKASFQQQRVRGVLSCLLAAPRRTLTREQIMEHLWPGEEPAKMSSRLDRVIYDLRKIFEPTRERNSYADSLLLVNQGLVTFAAQGQIWIDTEVFERLLSEAWKCSDVVEKEKYLLEAKQLYGGEFLAQEDTFSLLLSCRESLSRSWVSLLTSLADLQSTRLALPEAVETLYALLKIDPANEGVVQRLMRLLWQTGQRDKAVLIYKRLSHFLQKEYGILPLPETRGIFESMNRGFMVPQKASEKPFVVRSQVRSHQHVLIGREYEREEIYNLLALVELHSRFKEAGQKRAEFGEGRFAQAALVIGDIGIGKTRLAEEISTSARQKRWVVTWSRSYQIEASIPYRMWLDLLRQLFERTGALKHIRESPTIFLPLAVLFPELQEWMPASSSFSVEREQTLWEAILELLIFVGNQAPLLLVLDDLQWADKSSCELVIFLMRRIRGTAVFFLMTCRDYELSESHPFSPALPGLQREQSLEVLPLSSLKNEEIQELISSSSLATEHMSYVVQRAAGNPYFAEQLTKVLSTMQNLEKVSLPASISAALELRLSQLSHDCLKLLSRMSVLREAFTFSFLMQLEKLEEEVLLELLEEALRAGMISEEGTGLDVSYRFWHPLLAQHLYERVSSARRSFFHRQVAEVMFQQPKREEHAAAILLHFELAGVAGEIIAECAVMAGDYAYKLGSYGEAMQHYKCALSQEGVVQSEDILLWERYGEAGRIHGDQKTAMYAWAEVLRLHVPLRESERELHAAFLIGYAQIYYDVGLCEQATRYLDEARLFLPVERKGTVWGYFYWQQSCVLWMLGDFTEAERDAKHGLACFEEAVGERRSSPSEPTSLRRTIAGDPVDIGRSLRLLGALSIANAHAPNVPQGLKYAERALAIFEQCHRRREASGMMCDLGNMYMMLADYPQAKILLERCLSELQIHGDRPMIGVIKFNLGVTASAQRQEEEAQTYFEESVVLAEQIHDFHYIPLFASDYCLRLLRKGDFAKATIYLKKALIASHKVQDAIYAVSAYIALAGWLMYRAEGRQAGSKERMRLLHSAQALLDKWSEKLDTDFAAEASFLQVRLYRLQGESEQCSAELVRVWRQAKDQGLIWIQKRAESLEEELGVFLPK